MRVVTCSTSAQHDFSVPTLQGVQAAGRPSCGSSLAAAGQHAPQHQPLPEASVPQFVSYDVCMETKVWDTRVVGVPEQPLQ